MVLVMAAGQDEAIKIAQALVEERLAACVNIVGPARSIYRWQGQIENASEYMLMIKTRATHFSKIERKIVELHSYEVPEIIAIPLSAGSKPYLKWLTKSTVQQVGTPARQSRPLRNRAAPRNSPGE
jgi:periplasmic divalent cation tolerance protein